MSDDHAAIVAALQRAIDRGDNVQLARAFAGNPTWNGFPLALDDDLLLLRTLHDFDVDGFAVMRARDLTEVRNGSAERFFRRVLRGEKALEGLTTPDLPLSSWRAVVDSVRVKHRFAIVECERGDGAEFVLGELVPDDDVDSVAMRYIHVDGTLETAVTRVSLDDVTLLRFGERYLNLFGRYAVADHHQ